MEIKKGFKVLQQDCWEIGQEQRAHKDSAWNEIVKKTPIKYNFCYRNLSTVLSEKLHCSVTYCSIGLFPPKDSAFTVYIWASVWNLARPGHVPLNSAGVLQVWEAIEVRREPVAESPIAEEGSVSDWEQKLSQGKQSQHCPWQTQNRHPPTAFYNAYGKANVQRCKPSRGNS